MKKDDYKPEDKFTETADEKTLKAAQEFLKTLKEDKNVDSNK